MSENDKDNKEYEFIKEQVIEKKRKKIKRFLFPTITNVGFAILFGATAALTFVILEPKLSKYLQHEEEPITPVCFPTEYPQEPDVEDTNTPVVTPDTAEPTPVIVEQSIAADIDDYLSMNDDIRKAAHEFSGSIVEISSSFSVEDWFGKSVDKETSTTGVIVYNNTKELLIMVSLDRVKDADSIKIVLSDDTMVEAILQDYVSEINLAVIAVAIKDIPEYYMSTLKPATLGESYTVSVGSPILALGNPNGYSNSMEIGIVTSKGSIASITDDNLELFNTSITDNENSDGIIVNMKGKVIGLITRTLKEENNEEINTVIGISSLKSILEVMGNKGPHLYFGVKMQDMTDTAKTEYDIGNGIYVNDVLSDSPAFDAGIQKGDIILEIDQLPILDSGNFNNVISEYQPGDKLDVKIMRINGSKTSEINLYVTLQDKAK
jgi:serine protease Do